MAVTNTILATAMGGTSVLVFNKLLVDHQYSFLTVKSFSRSSPHCPHNCHHSV